MVKVSFGSSIDLFCVENQNLTIIIFQYLRYYIFRDGENVRLFRLMVVLDN